MRRITQSIASARKPLSPPLPAVAVVTLRTDSKATPAHPSRNAKENLSPGSTGQSDALMVRPSNLPGVLHTLRKADPSVSKAFLQITPRPDFLRTHSVSDRNRVAAESRPIKSPQWSGRLVYEIRLKAGTFLYQVVTSAPRTRFKDGHLPDQSPVRGLHKDEREDLSQMEALESGSDAFGQWWFPSPTATSDDARNTGAILHRFKDGPLVLAKVAVTKDVNAFLGEARGMARFKGGGIQIEIVQKDVFQLLEITELHPETPAADAD